MNAGAARSGGCGGRGLAGGGGWAQTTAGVYTTRRRITMSEDVADYLLERLRDWGCATCLPSR